MDKKKAPTSTERETIYWCKSNFRAQFICNECEKLYKPIVFIPNFCNFILDHHVFVEKLLNHDDTYFE